MTSSPKEAIGDRFIRLGTLLNSPQTTVEELVRAADECGLRMGVAFSAQAAEQVAFSDGDGQHE